MIKNIGTSSPYLYIQGGQTNHTYINNYGGAQGLGNLRFNTSSQNIEIWDGANWIVMSTAHATVNLTAEAEQLLNWAKDKRDKEKHLKELIEKNPTIADAAHNVQHAQEQLDIILKLTEIQQ